MVKGVTSFANVATETLKIDARNQEKLLRLGHNTVKGTFSGVILDSLLHLGERCLIRPHSVW